MNQAQDSTSAIDAGTPSDGGKSDIAAQLDAIEQALSKLRDLTQSQGGEGAVQSNAPGNPGAMATPELPGAGKNTLAGFLGK